MKSPQFFLRDLFWLVLVCALGIVTIRSQILHSRAERELASVSGQLKNQERVNFMLQRALENAGLGVDWLSGPKIVPLRGSTRSSQP